MDIGILKALATNIIIYLLKTSNTVPIAANQSVWLRRMRMDDKEKRAYSEDNPDFDITVYWFKELVKKHCPKLLIKDRQEDDWTGEGIGGVDKK